MIKLPSWSHTKTKPHGTDETHLYSLSWQAEMFWNGILINQSQLKCFLILKRVDLLLNVLVPQSASQLYPITFQKCKGKEVKMNLKLYLSFQRTLIVPHIKWQFFHIFRYAIRGMLPIEIIQKDTIKCSQSYPSLHPQSILCKLIAQTFPMISFSLQLNLELLAIGLHKWMLNLS